MQGSIKHLYRSKADIENLSRLRTTISMTQDTYDYKGVIVNKPWGYEYLMYENPHVAIWILHLKQNHTTSMHAHPLKKTSLIVLSGEVVCTNLEGWIPCSAGQVLIIEEGVFHMTKALSEGGAFIMEIESPPNKKDLVRLKDEYGRQNEGYEGKDKMTKITHEYEYIDFHNSSKRKQVKTIRDCSISLSFLRSTKNFKALKKNSGYLICLLSGEIHDGQEAILRAGEAALLSDIQEKKLRLFNDITCLTITHGKRKNKSI